MDEFFVQPVYHREEFSGLHHPAALTYFLEEKPEDSFEQGGNLRHGIQVFFQTCREKSAADIATDGSMGYLSMASYVREATLVPTVFLEMGNGKGAAKVRVVAGRFAGLSSVIPAQNFVLLDVFMRPGSEAKFSVNPCHGLLIYILEGVGIFKRNETSSKVYSFYENEGHGIWFPPWNGENTSDTFLHVLCHSWSSLRFLVLGSPLA